MSPDNSQFDTPESLTEEQLRVRVAECEVKLKEVAELVASVRHEINNPLTGVLGQAQLLLREEPTGKANQRARKIEELTLRISDIVAKLRAVQGPGESSSLAADGAARSETDKSS